MTISLILLGCWIVASFGYLLLYTDHPNLERFYPYDVPLRLPAIVLLVIALGVSERWYQLQDWKRNRSKND